MKRIFVALDGSVRADTVLTAAVRLAESCGASLVLFRGVGLPVDLPLSALAMAPNALEDALRSKAHADLEQLASTVSVPIERILVALGTAWDSIVTTAREVDADLIVVGSHGYTAVDRLLGTTAAKVVNRADRNVLVVRTPL